MEESRLSVRAAVFVAVLGTVLSWPYLDPFFGRSYSSDPPRQAAILDTAVNREQAFDVPLPANWNGRVIGILEGGRAYAIEREDGRRFYASVADMPATALQGRVSVRGLWLGTTCAYRNTVFSGSCVPDVQARSIKPLE